MIYKAFALTGRLVYVHDYPGRCPGLGASALSGRVANRGDLLISILLSCGESGRFVLFQSSYHVANLGDLIYFNPPIMWRIWAVCLISILLSCGESGRFLPFHWEYSYTLNILPGKARNIPSPSSFLLPMNPNFPKNPKPFLKKKPPNFPKNPKPFLKKKPPNFLLRRDGRSPGDNRHQASHYPCRAAASSRRAARHGHIAGAQNNSRHPSSNRAKAHGEPHPATTEALHQKASQLHHTPIRNTDIPPDKPGSGDSAYNAC